MRNLRGRKVTFWLVQFRRDRVKMGRQLWGLPPLLLCTHMGEDRAILRGHHGMSSFTVSISSLWGQAQILSFSSVLFTIQSHQWEVCFYLCGRLLWWIKLSTHLRVIYICICPFFRQQRTKTAVNISTAHLPWKTQNCWMQFLTLASHC
jgi:hypothetical protein